MPEPTEDKPEILFRHYNMEGSDDLRCLARLLQTVEDYDQDGEDVSETALRASLKWQGHDPQKDRWLAFHPDQADEAIGYTFIYFQTSHRAALHVAVHPDWRRRGLGQSLLERSLLRVRESGLKQVLCNANAKNSAANAFLHLYRFQLAGSAWSLHLPAGKPAAEPEWPVGFTVRRYVETPDLKLLTTVLNQSYADHWGHAENTPGAVDEARVARAIEYWRPEDLFIVFAPDGQAIGVCENHPTHDTAGEHLIGGPGFAPLFRSTELYRALTLTATHWLRHYGLNAIRLEAYGDDEIVVGIYQKLGFELDGQYLSYLYEL